MARTGQSQHHCFVGEVLFDLNVMWMLQYFSLKRHNISSAGFCNKWVSVLWYKLVEELGC